MNEGNPTDSKVAFSPVMKALRGVALRAVALRGVALRRLLVLRGGVNAHSSLPTWLGARLRGPIATRIRTGDQPRGPGRPARSPLSGSPRCTRSRGSDRS